MAGENGTGEEPGAFTKSYNQAREQLTDEQRKRLAEGEGMSSFAVEEENDGDQPGDDAPEGSQPEGNDEGDVPSEGDEPAGGDETSEPEGSESETTEASPDTLREKNRELSSELDNVKEQRNQLQQREKYLLETEEGQQQLVQYLKQQGRLDDLAPQADPEDAPDPGGVIETLSEWDDVLPDGTVDRVKKLAAAASKQTGTTQSDAQTQTEDQEGPPLDPQGKQLQQEFQDKVQQMAQSEEYELYDELAKHRPGQKLKGGTWLDHVMWEHQDRFMTAYGIPNPDKLEEMYKVAKKEYQGTSDANPGNDDSPEEKDEDDMSKEELKQKYIEEGRQKALDQLEKNEEDEVLDPGGGQSDVSPNLDERPSLRESFQEAKRQTGVSVS